MSRKEVTDYYLLSKCHMGMICRHYNWSGLQGGIEREN